MRSILIASLMLGATVCTQAETVKGNGKVKEEVREVADFQSIRSEGAWSLDVRVGPAPSIRIKADDNLLPLIQTVVEKNELTIRLKEDVGVRLRDGSSLRIEVTVPKLSAYTHEGAGKTAFHDLHGEGFALKYEGAGLITATGKVDNVDINAEGAGAIDFDALKARNVTVKLEGIGSVSVYASEALRADVEGIGSLTYYGKPAKVSKSVSGIGTVRAGD
ncbi:head GIN domain-containing protein [Chitinimonas sp. BJYL2]|uniref:head GIN domain-containing protein n=1 Tax=Chitinimonas sp. BJYL2 TaxID=2976696 RepID=UPI0022B48469|nr:head GIN domain-containing protein [Chitinimonas sp. BJYL2]